MFITNEYLNRLKRSTLRERVPIRESLPRQLDPLKAPKQRRRVGLKSRLRISLTMQSFLIRKVGKIFPRLPPSFRH